MFRIIKESRPRWIIAENVIGIIHLALGQVLFDLESIGYNFPRNHRGIPIISVIPACGVNAPHRRNRIWTLAYNDSPPNRLSRQGDNKQLNSFGGWKTLGNVGTNILQSEQDKQWRRIDTRDWRGFNGVPHRVDRLKSLGNAIVPQVAAEIMRGIRMIEDNKIGDDSPKSIIGGKISD